MPRYEVVLFDADHTLFDFDRAEREALRQTLEEAGLPADGETEARYLSINRALWNRLDRGEVRREWLVVERFAALLRALGRTGDAAALNRAYLDHLGEGSYLLPGAQALCRALAPRCTLAIVTNGVARAQRRRFEASPLNGDTELFLDTLMHTLGLAGALAVGVLLVASVVRLFTTYQSRRRG